MRAKKCNTDFISDSAWCWYKTWYKLCCWRWSKIIDSGAPSSGIVPLIGYWASYWFASVYQTSSRVWLRTHSWFPWSDSAPPVSCVPAGLCGPDARAGLGGQTMLLCITLSAHLWSIPSANMKAPVRAWKYQLHRRESQLHQIKLQSIHGQVITCANTHTCSKPFLQVGLYHTDITYLVIFDFKFKFRPCMVSKCWFLWHPS